MTKDKMKKWAIVTGASHGLGYAVSLFLSRLGYSIIAVSRRAKQLEKLSAEIQKDNGLECIICPIDISKPSQLDQLQAIIDDVTSLKVLVHCASASVDPDNDAIFLENDQEYLLETLNTNVIGTSLVLKLCLKAMTTSEGGHAFFIASDWALRGSHGPAAFSASKAYIAQLARTMKLETKSNNIFGTCLFVGDIATFDVDWEQPKWHLDDNIKAQEIELGNTRIPIVDICETIEFCITRKKMHVEEIILSPLDAEYEY